MSHEPTNASPHHATPSGPPPPAPTTAADARGADGSLKYHLLGPSLQKSGQDGVADIIYNASKGSKFFNNESVKDRVLTEKIDRILARKRQLQRTDLSHDLRRADSFAAELELGRDLSQAIVHLDCDAFYAAVEELDRPELKHVPFAVGKGVLTTCNYHARKFGCRSGMAGFVAMKLCPQLICLPLNFDKYTAKAREVRAVLEQYDPCFESASIDEAYLNITAYCEQHDMDPEDAVQQLRAEVHEKTKITVSAGIAANAKLAKICSNKNKPNGQFRLANDRATIMAFMRDLATRKVNGIGRVFERELDAIGVKTCGDIYEHRAYLPKLFGEKAFQFLMQCYLGLGRTKIQPAESYERKSVGTESTFRDMSDKDELRAKLWHTAEELEKDLERTQFKGRTLVLKVKLHTYEVLSRQTSPPFAVYRKDDLYKYALPMLAKLEKEIPGMKLRLMGLRATHIVSMKKGSVDFFGLNKRITSADSSTSEQQSAQSAKAKTGSEDEWEVWPEEEFEEAARQEREADFVETLRLSQQEDRGVQEGTEGDTQPQAAEIHWDCPICLRPQPANDRAFNDHVDFCLSRDAIKETVKEANESGTPPPQAQSDTESAKPKDAFGLMGMKAGSATNGGQKKRGRPRSDGLGSGHGQKDSRKRPFFG
ncbi:dna polymerase kappa subunit [Diplodia corticola]|uniref:DNA polymerase kappa n=1 Tax=Diplodia corticola TaxID=236234 RepID=A0A1J9S8P3_9PEZI|nr:dna polymerase kappa subunit [Diplodia corticola]OJD36879.1 dna polymerase kappa subunit [Diplodia corticola]